MPQKEAKIGCTSKKLKYNLVFYSVCTIFATRNKNTKIMEVKTKIKRTREEVRAAFKEAMRKKKERMEENIRRMEQLEQQGFFA